MKRLTLYIMGLILYIVVILILTFSLPAKNENIKNENELEGKTTIQIANPASVNCQENNGTLEIRTNSDGSQYGICIFSDGSECDEWLFFKDKCKQGENK